MVVCYTATKDFYAYLPTVLNSLLLNNNDIIDKIYLFIQDDNIDTITNDKVEFINVTKYDNYMLPMSPNLNNKYSNMIMYKLSVAKFLPPNLDRCIFIDVDTIVDGSIEELNTIDMGDNTFLGVKELNVSYNLDTLYINAGVLVINLRSVRAAGNTDMLINYVNLVKLSCPEQDAINTLFSNRIGEIDSKYNYSVTTKFSPNPVIYHWAGIEKAWNQDGKNPIWNKYYTNELK